MNKEVDILIFVQVFWKPYVHSSYGAILNTLKHQVLKTLFLCNFMITKILLFFVAVPLVEFAYLLFTYNPAEIYHR